MNDLISGTVGDSPETGPRTALQQLARKHGVSESAVAELLSALQRGGGGMAQFDHPELGGYGQWMGNGMIMISDMFNHALKAKVDALCRDLLPLLRGTAGRTPPATNPSLIRREPSAWWPAQFTSVPAALGAQNSFRYAYFPAEHALVVEEAGKTLIYDTTGHEVHGFGQQQIASSGVSLTSSGGTIDVSQLPRRPA